MPRTWPREKCSRQVVQAAGAVLLLASLAVLVGCQGVSAAGNSSQQQTANLVANNASLAFGSVTAGTSKSLNAEVTNSGPASVTITSVTSSTQYFALISPALPVTLAAGQAVYFDVEFSPNAAGTFNATLTVTSNATNTAPTISLTGTGTGTAPGVLSLNPTSENFGTITPGTQLSKTVTLTNTGGTSVNISQPTVSGTGFQLSGLAAQTLGASQSTTFTVTFAPLVSGNASGLVTIPSDASNPSLTMALSGAGSTPGFLSPNPASFSFGSVNVGSTLSQSETITNTGDASVTMSIAVSGTGFSLSNYTSVVTLAGGQSTTFTVNFTPTATGSDTGSISISSNASNPSLSISLTGTGTTNSVGTLAATPTTLPLGSVVVGTSGTASGSLTASGASVTVTAASTTNSAFTVSGLSLPVTIPSGQSVPFTVTFNPQVTGAASATLTFTSNAQPSSTTETLTGTGTAAPVHSVNLSWTASTSSDVSGYNVYRAVYTSSCGSFSKINSALDATTVYTDSNVVDGTNYCYATTAVDTSNQESGYSNIVSDVQIPAP